MKRITDFAAHNAEVERVWGAYHARRPVRVPVIFGINPRFLLLDDVLNTEGITFKEYSTDPRVMLEVQVRTVDYIRHNVPQDAPMGLPEAWDVNVDLQNYYEAGYLGAPVEFAENEVPYARHFLDDDNKWSLIESGVPEAHETPLGKRMIEFYDYMLEAKRKGFEYKGRPIGRVTPRGLGTDGPMTLLMSIRGQEALIDMYADPDYFHRMMGFLTEFIVRNIRATRTLAGRTQRPERFDFADDSIELLSVADYRDHVLPYHKRLLTELAGAGPHSIHICGDVQRHFPMLIRELNVRAIDTGFPIDFDTLRDEIGDDVEISGGVHVELLVRGAPEKVRAETGRILETPITRGGRFIMREANNLAPRTPLANLYAMYEAAREYGTYAE